MLKLNLKNAFAPLLLGVTAILSSDLPANAKPVVIQRTTVYPIQQPTVIYTNPVYNSPTAHPLSRRRRNSTIHFPSPQIIVPGQNQVVYPPVIVNPTIVYPPVYQHQHSQNQGSYIYLGSDGVQIRLSR
ncbi:MAG: hypothetical protein WA865_16745 [Spirulinaceae cyanobacterium]